ncbi:MAG: hypothetical protein JWR24_135 [Actinoallomurus sp.]|nr:hypothetical protein [Actinoallomurus sp.]
MADIGDVDAALAALDVDDPETGRLAADAFQSLTWGEGLESVTQLGLQEFLWYQLPAKSPAPPAETQAGAAALGRLFAQLGLDRYAAICVSETTRVVIGAYESGRDKGVAAYRKALTASGIEPPELPELAWGSIMGSDEAAAFYAAAGALELAQAAGVFSVGARSWRTAQRSVATDVLTRPQSTLGGGTWLEKVQTERLAIWARGRSTTRTALIDPILGRLRTAPAVPDDATRALEPVRWLLNEAADGITLTQIGNLPKSLVVAMNDAYNYYDLPGYHPRGEHDVLPLTELRELLRKAGLVRRTGRRLVLTPDGRRHREDLPALWQTVTGQLAAGEGFEAAVAEIGLLALADGRPVDSAHFERTLIDAADEQGWHDPATKAAPDSRTIAYARAHLRHRLQALRLLVTEKTWNAPYQLTPAGQAAAITALRTRALRPRTNIEG